MKLKPTNEVFAASPREGYPLYPIQELRRYDELTLTTSMVLAYFKVSNGICKN